MCASCYLMINEFRKIAAMLIKVNRVFNLYQYKRVFDCWLDQSTNLKHNTLEIEMSVFGYFLNYK